MGYCDRSTGDDHLSMLMIICSADYEELYLLQVCACAIATSTLPTGRYRRVPWETAASSPELPSRPCERVSAFIY